MNIEYVEKKVKNLIDSVGDYDECEQIISDIVSKIIKDKGRSDELAVLLELAIRIGSAEHKAIVNAIDKAEL